MSLAFLLLTALVSSVVCDHSGSDDPLDWLRDSIPGEPGLDYPIFNEVQETSFSCEGRKFGGKNKNVNEYGMNI